MERLMKTNPNVFANYPIDRAAHFRRDQAWLDRALTSDQARLCVFRDLQPFLMDEGRGPHVAWLDGGARDAFAPGALPLFLGIDDSEAPYFAIELPRGGDFPLEQMGEFTDLRAAAANVDGGDLAIVGTAKWLFDWHRRHSFCAACGEKKDVYEAGWKRICPNCSTEHFPRTDPVVIMVPAFGDKICLGRQPRWPRGMYSALAGFVEPGESLEDAVAREVLEEAGLKVVSVRYHSTQPWPFPSSLMIGALCTVDSDMIAVDGEELEEARWFTREEVHQMLERKHPNANAPGRIAIAHQIIKAWADGA